MNPKGKEGERAQNEGKASTKNHRKALFRAVFHILALLPQRALGRLLEGLPHPDELFRLITIVAHCYPRAEELSPRG
mgnify:CR=1 FL=1